MSSALAPTLARETSEVRLSLVRRIAAGDEGAFAELYEQTNRRVYGLVLRIVRDPAVAEEVALDVYMQVWKNAVRFDARRGSPIAWLLVLARSRAIDRLRAVGRDRAHVEPLEAVEYRVASDDLAPDAVAADSERSRRVRVALDALSPDQREAIELAYFDGMTHTEVAEYLGRPLGTVKTRIRLGMIRLRELLDFEL